MVIAGGCRGIGTVTARLAALSGYAGCISFFRDRPAASAVVDEIRRAGGEAIAFAADVSVEAEVVRLFEQANEALGSVAALVNNAGILEQHMRVVEMDAARLSRVFTTDVIGTFTFGLAKEVASEGIRVNAVRPDVIYTDIHASGGEPNRVDRVKGGQKPFLGCFRMMPHMQPECCLMWRVDDEDV